VKRLALLPTRPEALSQLVSAFNSVLMMFALAVEARKTQLEEGGAPASEPASPEPAPETPAPSTDSTSTPDTDTGPSIPQASA
jgi:hypothetical protein